MRSLTILQEPFAPRDKTSDADSLKSVKHVH